MVEDKLLKLQSVLEYIQISKTKIYDLMAAEKFPQPTRIGGNVLWLMSDIQEYIKSVKKQVS